MVIPAAIGTTARVLVAVYGAYGVLKFTLFMLPYTRRRTMLDKGYAGKASATALSDNVLLAFVVILSVLLFGRGVEATSFLGGLLVGATLIQLFFHRFNRALSGDRAPDKPISPIKMMSFAIQDAPARAWKEMAVFAVLVLCALTLMVRH